MALSYLSGALTFMGVASDCCGIKLLLQIFTLTQLQSMHYVPLHPLVWTRPIYTIIRYRDQGEIHEYHTVRLYFSFLLEVKVGQYSRCYK